MILVFLNISSCSAEPRLAKSGLQLQQHPTPTEPLVRLKSDVTICMRKAELTAAAKDDGSET